MHSYSKGAFLHVTTADWRCWEQNLAEIRKVSAPDHLEVWLEYLPTVTEMVDLVSLLRGTKTIVHGPFIHLTIASHLEGIASLSLDRFKRTMEVASAIDAEVVTFHAGTRAFFHNEEQAFELVDKRFAPFAGMRNPTPALENMPFRAGTTTDLLSSLVALSAFGRRLQGLRFTLDIGHAIQNGEDFLAFIRKECHRIVNIHLHDGRHRGPSHLSIGKGELDLPGTLRTFQASGYSGFVGLETLGLRDTRDSWQEWQECETSLLS